MTEIIEEKGEKENLIYAQYKSANGCYVCINVLTKKVIGKKCGGMPFKNIRIIILKE